MLALIERNQLLTPLLKVIEDIRSALSQAIDSDRVVTGTRAPTEDSPSDELRRHPTMALERAMAIMDAVAIDDRALNRHLHWSHSQGKATTPIICTLDIMQHLRQAEKLSDTELDNAYFRLRNAGFNVVPVTPDELFRLTGVADAKDRLVETGELRAIRASIARLVAFQAIRLPEENLALENLRMAVITSIRRVWTEGCNVSDAKHKSEWLLELLPDPYTLATVARGETALELAMQGRTAEIALLAMPLFETPQLIDVYAQWVDQTLIEPLRQSDPALLKRVLRRLDLLLAEAAKAPADP